MGILDKIFGNNNRSEEENKWAIFLNLCNQISSLDGVFSEEEAQFSQIFLSKYASNFSNSDWDRICANAESMGQSALDKAKNLNESDKYELISYLSGVAASDGKFDGKEYAWILVLSITIGLEQDKVFNILSNFDIDYDEATEQMSEMLEKMKNAGLM